MAKLTNLSFCQKLIIWHQTSSHKFSMCLYCVRKYQIVSAKALVQDDFPAYVLSMHKQNALRITKGNNSEQNWPLALFILIQMFILWISMCLQSLMKFHHCLFKILRKNQNVVDKDLQRAITLTELAISPYISIINNHLVDINAVAKSDEIPSLPVQVMKEKPKCPRLRITKGNNSKRIGP